MDSCAGRLRPGLRHFKYGDTPSIYVREQYFSAAALLTLWVGYFFVVGLLCVL